jgi:hypothetical protein
VKKVGDQQNNNNNNNNNNWGTLGRLPSKEKGSILGQG